MEINEIQFNYEQPTENEIKKLLEMSEVVLSASKIMIEGSKNTDDSIVIKLRECHREIMTELKWMSNFGQFKQQAIKDTIKHHLNEHSKRISQLSHMANKIFAELEFIKKTSSVLSEMDFIPDNRITSMKDYFAAEKKRINYVTTKGNWRDVFPEFEQRVNATISTPLEKYHYKNPKGLPKLNSNSNSNFNPASFKGRQRESETHGGKAND